MSIIIDFIIGLVLSALGYVASIVTDTVSTLIGVENLSSLSNPTSSMVLGGELMENFLTAFPLMNEFFNALLLISHLAVIAILINGMVKALFGQMARTAENPVILATRAAFASFLIRFSAVIAGFFLHLGSILYAGFVNITTDGNGSALTEVVDKLQSSSPLDMVKVGGDTVVMLTPAKSVFLIIVLFLGIALIVSYMKLVLEIIERYVTIAFLALVSPVMIATLASASTTQYFFSWIKMMLSQAVLMGFSALWLNAFETALKNATTSTVAMGWVGFILLLTAFVVLGTKIDRHMRDLGFTVAQGGDFGAGVFGAMALTRSITKDHARGVEKRQRAALAADPNYGAKVSSGNKGDRKAQALVSQQGHGDMSNMKKGTSVVTERKDGTTTVAAKNQNGETDIAYFNQNKEMEMGTGGYAELTSGVYSGGDAQNIIDSQSKDAMDNMENFDNVVSDKDQMLDVTSGEDLANQLQEADLSAGDSLMTVGDFDEMGNAEMMSSVQLADEGFDEQGNLLRYNEDGELDANGDFIKTRDEDGNVDFTSLDEIADSGHVAVGKDSDGAFFYDNEGEAHRLADGAVSVNEDGHVLAERYNEDGSIETYYADAGLNPGESGQTLSTFDVGEQIVPAGDESLIDTNYSMKESATTLGELNDREAVMEQQAFNLDSIKDDLPSNYQKELENKGFSSNARLVQDTGHDTPGVTAGQITGQDNGKLKIMDANDPSKVMELPQEYVKQATVAPTVGESDARGWIGKNEGFVMTDKDGNTTAYAFNERSRNGNELKKPNDTVSVFNTQTRQEEQLKFNDIKDASMVNLSSTYKGVEVNEQGRMRASDITRVQNEVSHQELHFKDGSKMYQHQSDHTDRNKMHHNRNNTIDYTGGRSRTGKTAVMSSSQLRVPSGAKSTPASAAGYQDFGGKAARNMYKQLKGANVPFKAKDIQSVSYNAEAGQSIFRTKSGQAVVVVDAAQNKSYRAGQSSNFVSNRKGERQILDIVGSKEKPANMQDIYSNLSASAPIADSGRTRIKSDFQNANNKNFKYKNDRRDN